MNKKNQIVMSLGGSLIVPDEIDVLFFTDLPDLTLADLPRGPEEKRDDLVVPVAKDRLDGAIMKVISRKNRRLRPRFNMERRNTTPERSRIDNVVMNKRCGMKDLGRRGEVKFRGLIPLRRDPMSGFERP